MPRPLEVALICPPAKAKHTRRAVYGAGLHIRQLIRYLPEHNINLWVFASASNIGVLCDDLMDVLPSVRFCHVAHAQDEGDSPDSDLCNARFFAQALRQHAAFRSHSFGIVHTQHWKATGLLSFLPAYQPNAAMVHTPHLLAGAKQLHSGAAIPVALSNWEKNLVESVDALVLVSTAERSDVSQLYPSCRPDSLIVVPNGFDHLPSQARPRAPLPGEPLRLVSVGRMARQKNWLFLLEMMAGAKNQGLDWHLSLLGGGYESGYENQLRDFCRAHGLSDCVEFAGYVAPEGVSAKLRDSHLYVHSASYESQCIALGEAMTYGLPCVLTNSRGMSDFFSDQINGFFVETPGAACLAVQRLQNDPSLWNGISQTNRRVREIFTWQRTAQQTVALYQNLWKKKGLEPPQSAIYGHNPSVNIFQLTGGSA